MDWVGGGHLTTIEGTSGGVFANKSRSGHSVTIFSNARGLPEGGGGARGWNWLVHYLSLSRHIWHISDTWQDTCSERIGNKMANVMKLRTTSYQLVHKFIVWAVETFETLFDFIVCVSLLGLRVRLRYHLTRQRWLPCHKPTVKNVNVVTKSTSQQL